MEPKNTLKWMRENYTDVEHEVTDFLYEYWWDTAVQIWCDNMGIDRKHFDKVNNEKFMPPKRGK